MKTVLIALSLVILCLAVMYGVPQYQRSREAARRQRAMQQGRLIEDRTPLVLDAKTQAILDSADRVETFRLAGGGDEDYTKQEQAAIGGPHPQYLDHYPIMDVGQVQGKAFAASLKKALSQGTGVEDDLQCFEPGVGFRVWKGASHTDMCICFYCSGIQITTPDTSPKSLRQNPYYQRIMLGEARPALLALSKQAFPQDTNLAALH